jgi:hypothetical protein
MADSKGPTNTYHKGNLSMKKCTRRTRQADTHIYCLQEPNELEGENVSTYRSVERAAIASPPTPRSFGVKQDRSETIVGKTCREIEDKINTDKKKKAGKNAPQDHLNQIHDRGSH